MFCFDEKLCNTYNTVIQTEGQDFAEQEIGFASLWVNTQTVSIHLSHSPSQSVLDWIQLTLKTHRAAAGFHWLVEDHENITSGYIMTQRCLIFKEEIYSGHGIPQHTVWTEGTEVLKTTGTWDLMHAMQTTEGQ